MQISLTWDIMHKGFYSTLLCSLLFCSTFSTLVLQPALQHHHISLYLMIQQDQMRKVLFLFLFFSKRRNWAFLGKPEMFPWATAHKFLCACWENELEAKISHLKATAIRINNRKSTVSLWKIAELKFLIRTNWATRCHLDFLPRLINLAFCRAEHKP